MNYDFAIIGAGIAGASAAYFLSQYGQVALLEREDRPGYHTTGRSAAFFTLNYGNRVIRALTEASKEFLTDPPDGFTDHPLMSPRGIMTIARPDQLDRFQTNLAEARAGSEPIEEIDVDAALEILPVLRRDYLAAAHLETGSMYLDVDLILNGYLRGMQARGGELRCAGELRRLRRAGGVWRLETASGTLEAPVVVNAAGAWADEVARLAGLAPVGLEPRRRTVIIFPGPADVAIEDCPMAIDVDEEFYFKPEAGKVLASPADETPSPACDAQPEEIDIALTVERIERATIMKVARIDHKWAGLRSFVADRTPVVGPDPEGEGFLWLAGQGGYGIMTSPAMGRAAAALATGAGDWPEDLAARGVLPAQLAPRRESLRPAA